MLLYISEGTEIKDARSPGDEDERFTITTIIINTFHLVREGLEKCPITWSSIQQLLYIIKRLWCHHTEPTHHT